MPYSVGSSISRTVSHSENRLSAPAPLFYTTLPVQATRVVNRTASTTDCSNLVGLDSFDSVSHDCLQKDKIVQHSTLATKTYVQDPEIAQPGRAKAAADRVNDRLTNPLERMVTIDRQNRAHTAYIVPPLIVKTTWSILCHDSWRAAQQTSGMGMLPCCI